MIEYFLIILFVTIFGILHSGVSALPVKSKIIDRWGKEGYAKTFNATSILSISLAFLSMWFWDWLYFLFTPSLVQPFLFLGGGILIVIGLWLSMAASKVISVSTVADMRTDRRPELITDGIYSRVRHPLYLATIILLFGLVLIYPFAQVAVFSLSLIIYTLIGAYLEERKLVLHYGDEYLEYRKRAGFLLPKSRHL
ncbi:MAG: methyltransferase family protein [Candidatus Thorarchaeota archaeon]